MEEATMAAAINLRGFYPWYAQDEFVEVPDEVAAAMLEAERQERNYLRRIYRHKAYYSLDAGDGIEHEALLTALSPAGACEYKLTMGQLYCALGSLPARQSRRIYAHFMLGISQAEIAQAEGVDSRNIRKSVSKGLRGMENYLKKFC
jgi:RNA polymerase sigma-70 factor (ECF subfamily)